jgi:flagellar biosynthesis chaperone FliJ
METKQTGTLSAQEFKIDAPTLRNAFIYHGIAGAILILLLRLIEAHILVAVISCAALMCSYLYQFKKGGEPHGLIDTFADSVYYLGFILTLLSLIISMMFFDVDEGANSASYILAQFGAAMTTTLLGMVFRIYYKQFDTTLESAQLSVREALDETVKGFNIQMRSTNDTLARLSEVMNKNIEDTETRNGKSLELYESTQKKIVTLGEDSLNDLSTKTNALISQSIDELNNYAGKTSSAIEEMVQKILNSNSQNAKASSDEIKQLLESMTQEITSKFFESIGGLTKSAGTLNKAFSEANGNTKKLNESFIAVAENMADLESIKPNMESMTASQNEYINSLDSFSTSLNNKVKNVLGAENQIADHLTKLTNEYKEVLEQFKKMAEGTGVKQISLEENKLIEALQTRRASLEELAQQWSNDTENMSKNSKLFTENLVKTSKFIARELRGSETTEMEKVS